MFMRLILVVLALCGGVASAEVAAVAPDPAMAALAQAMPAKRLKALRAAPEGYLADAARLIYATGLDGKIDAAGIETYIAVRRADLRAQSMALFLRADLNNDGAIGTDEARLYAATLAARGRADLRWGFDLADADVDGSVSPAELRSHADLTVMKALDETDAAGLRSLMLFDLDGDGTVTMDEVVGAVASLAEAG